MAKVRVGPFSDIHFSKIAQKLIAAGAEFEKIEDPEAARKYAEQAPPESPTIYPVFSGRFVEYIFIELKKEHLMLIKKDLTDLGYSFADSEPLPEIAEPPPETRNRGRGLVTLLLLVSLAVGYLIFYLQK